MTEQTLETMRRVALDPDRQRVRFCEVERAFRLAVGDASHAKEVSLRGVTSLLRQVFWPDYDYKLAERLAPTARAAKVSSGLRAAHHGRNRGSAVHEQLACWVNEGEEACRRRCARMHSRVHPYVLTVVRGLKDKRVCMQPVWSEFIVFDASARLASAIDLVCLAPSGVGLVLCELKAGGANYFQKASGAMHGPLVHMNNSPLHQAMVQVLVYKCMLERRYPELGDFVAGCCVVQVTEERVRFKQVPAELVARADQIYDYLVATAAALRTRN